MIVHPTPDVLRVLFTLKGSIVKRIALRCLMVTLLAALIVLIERHYPAAHNIVEMRRNMVVLLTLKQDEKCASEIEFKTVMVLCIENENENENDSYRVLEKFRGRLLFI